jgi:hypothetical protein
LGIIYNIERFVGASPKEMHANIMGAKKKKPPGDKKPSGSVDDPTNVMSLRASRHKRHNGR